MPRACWQRWWHRIKPAWTLTVYGLCIRGCPCRVHHEGLDVPAERADVRVLQQLPDLLLAGVVLLLLACLQLIAADGCQVAKWRIRGVRLRLAEAGSCTRRRPPGETDINLRCSWRCSRSTTGLTPPSNEDMLHVAHQFSTLSAAGSRNTAVVTSTRRLMCYCLYLHAHSCASSNR